MTGLMTGHVGECVGLFGVKYTHAYGPGVPAGLVGDYCDSVKAGGRIEIDSIIGVSVTVWQRYGANLLKAAAGADPNIPIVAVGVLLHGYINGHTDGTHFFQRGIQNQGMDIIGAAAGTDFDFFKVAIQQGYFVRRGAAGVVGGIAGRIVGRTAGGAAGDIGHGHAQGPGVVAALGGRDGHSVKVSGGFQLHGLGSAAVSTRQGEGRDIYEGAVTANPDIPIRTAGILLHLDFYVEIKGSAVLRRGIQNISMGTYVSITGSNFYFFPVAAGSADGHCEGQQHQYAQQYGQSPG